MAKHIFRPGQIASTSGQYVYVGPRGGISGKEVTVVKGEPFPPSPKPGMGFMLSDKTRH